jgi:hypothetical protein
MSIAGGDFHKLAVNFSLLGSNILKFFRGQTTSQWEPKFHALIKMIMTLSLGMKRPECEADHSPPSSAEVKNELSYISIPPIRLHDVVLS